VPHRAVFVPHWAVFVPHWAVFVPHRAVFVSHWAVFVPQWAEFVPHWAVFVPHWAVCVPENHSTIGQQSVIHRMTNISHVQSDLQIFVPIFVTSSPRYPKSNGLAEKTVQTIKLLSKALSSHQDPCLAILENRNTPVDGFATPAQLLMSRNLRSTIPALPTHFKPEVVDAQEFQDNREKVQQQQKVYHDKHTNSLPSLEEGEHVRMRYGKSWKHVTVTKNANETRSYIMQNTEGRKYRRNRSQLLKLNNQSSWQLKDREEENEVTVGLCNEMDSLNSSHKQVGQSKELSKYYITRSGCVSKPPQRLIYS
jgi:hypothetical protein